MTILKCLAGLLFGALLAACSIQSDVLLPDLAASGDMIEGLPASGPFRLQTFDRDKGEFKSFATIDATADGSQARYLLSFDDGTPTRLMMQAKKMSQGNYLVRFTQVAEGRPASLSESLDALDKSQLARDAFGDQVIEHYLVAGRHEVREFAAAVTDWELRRSFERL